MRLSLRNRPSTTKLVIVCLTGVTALAILAILIRGDYSGTEIILTGETLMFAPQSQSVPAGATAIFVSKRILEWDSVTMPAVIWSVDANPGVGAVEITHPAGYPGSARILVHIDPDAEAGRYTVEIAAEAGEHTWRGEIQLQIMPCVEDAAAGMHTADREVDLVSGGPTSMVVGVGASPIQFCALTAPRRLRVIVQSATDESGAPLVRTQIELVLIRILGWPPATKTLHIEGHIAPDSETVVRCSGSILEWDIEPGVYLIYFPQNQLLTGVPIPWQFYPQVSVTYWLLIEPFTASGEPACPDSYRSMGA